MNFEFEILNLLQKLHTPALDALMCFITSLGNAGMIWILLTILLLINPKIGKTEQGTARRLFGRCGRRSGCVLLAALCIDLIVCNGILKNLFCRIRPFDVNTAIQLLVDRPKDFSFPSGHTAASFASAAALYFAGEKRLWKPALLLACLIAFSRLYLYVHYPTDVLGGMLIGAAAGYGGSRLITFLEKRK